MVGRWAMGINNRRIGDPFVAVVMLAMGAPAMIMGSGGDAEWLRR